MDSSSDKASFLQGQLEKTPEESKKYKATVLGLKGVTGFFLAGVAMILFRPEIATQSTTLVQFALTAWGGLVSIYLGGSSAVEWKTTAALQEVHRTEDSTMTLRQEDLEQNAREKLRPE